MGWVAESGLQAGTMRLERRVYAAVPLKFGELTGNPTRTPTH